MAVTELALIFTIAICVAQAVALYSLSKRIDVLSATIARTSTLLIDAVMEDRAGYRQVRADVARAESPKQEPAQPFSIGPDPVPTGDSLTVRMN